MIDKILSIIIALISGRLLYTILKKKNNVILNYNFNKNDNLEINNKCYTSN